MSCLSWEELIRPFSREQRQHPPAHGAVRRRPCLAVGALNGCIGSPHVLIEGSPELVRRRTGEDLEVMKPGGGLAGPTALSLAPRA